MYFLEAFNIPILFVPIFYHPDPSVKSKNRPSYSKNFLTQILLVQFMNSLFFLTFNTSNLITKARLSTKEGLFLMNDHNAISNKSNFKIKVFFD